MICFQLGLSTFIATWKGQSLRSKCFFNFESHTATNLHSHQGTLQCRLCSFVNMRKERMMRVRCSYSIPDNRSQETDIDVRERSPLLTIYPVRCMPSNYSYGSLCISQAHTFARQLFMSIFHSRDDA